MPDLGKRGNVASITNAANHTTYITDYNPHGQPTRIVDPNGVVTVLTYDPRMRLTSRTVGNEATVFGYDPVGQMTSVNLPDGARLIYTYDAAHRLTAINDHKGNRIDYTLDAMGNRITEKTKDPGGDLSRQHRPRDRCAESGATGDGGRAMSRATAVNWRTTMNQNKTLQHLLHSVLLGALAVCSSALGAEPPGDPILLRRQRQSDQRSRWTEPRYHPELRHTRSAAPHHATAAGSRAAESGDRVRA